MAKVQGVADLPDAVLENVLSFLDARDLCRLSSTCTSLRTRVDSSVQWEVLCLDRFGTLNVVRALLAEAGIPLKKARPEPTDWKKEYVRRSQRVVDEETIFNAHGHA